MKYSLRRLFFPFPAAGAFIAFGTIAFLFVPFIAVLIFISALTFIAGVFFVAFIGAMARIQLAQFGFRLRIRLGRKCYKKTQFSDFRLNSENRSGSTACFLLCF